MIWRRCFITIVVFLICLINATAYAHHVLGRPAYALNEDSNTPSSMHVETQIGDYFVNYMIFPAFPRPGSPGRVNLYAKRIENGEPFEGNVTFTVQNDSWFDSKPELLGTQGSDDSVYRQGFVFKEKGNYILTARFDSEGDPYAIDFPLRVGEKSPIGPLSMAVALILMVLISVKIIRRKGLLRETIRAAHRDQERH